MLGVGLLIGQGVAVAAGLRIARRGRSPDRVLMGLVPPAAWGLAALVATAILSAPYSPWDVVRLAPTMALARGHSLYATRDSGPILSTMYPPVSALAYLPAALATDPATAARIGRALACVYGLLPIFLVGFSGGLGRGSRGPRRWALVLLASLAALTLPALRYSITCIHADAPALGLAGAACWVVSREEGRGGWGPAVLAAVLGWLSVWAKQTMIGLPLALTLGGVATSGTRAGLRSALVALGVGVVLSGGFLIVVDRDALVLNTWLVPGRFPWKGPALECLAVALAELGGYAWPFVVVLASLPARADGSRRWQPFAIAAAVLAPLAVLGRVKRGGDLNSFSPTLSLLLLACVARAEAVGGDSSAPIVRGRRLLALGLAGLVALAVPTWIGEAKVLTKLRPARAEVEFLRGHPDQVYFPWHPLAHLAAEGRATHHLQSAWERGVAGVPVSSRHLRAEVPPGCRYACFPLRRLGPAVELEGSLLFLSEHHLLRPGARPVRIKGLPDYECYELVNPVVAESSSGELRRTRQTQRK